VICFLFVPIIFPIGSFPHLEIPGCIPRQDPERGPSLFPDLPGAVLEVGVADGEVRVDGRLPKILVFPDPKGHLVLRLERLAQVGLEGAEGKYPDELSGGMVRRVAFARAMVTDPEIILFDEPTTGLDPIIRNSILNLICHTYHRHGFTMVMISHDIPEIFQWSHHVAVLHDGKVVQAAPTAEVVNSVDPFGRQLIRGDITGPVHLM